jgi:hypothetical protein
MALDLYRAAVGFSIDEEDGTRAASVLSGSGAPGGDTSFQDDAPIGSIYLRTDASSSISAVYQKIADTNATSDWVQSASKDYVQSVVNGMSWREPVLVLDETTYADITAAETAANVADTVDGVTIAANDRILFTDLTTGNENVYIVSGSSGNWTFTEDPDNAATDGDALLVQDGTYAESQWVYDGTQWTQIASTTNNAELAFIRAFIGKDAAGSETPTYSSAVVVTQNGTLEAAIGELDAAIGDRLYTNDNVLTDGQTITASLDAIDTAIGNRTYTEQNFVTNGETLTASIDALDIAVADAAPKTAVATGVTTATTVDTVLVDEVQTVKWFVTVFDEADTDQKESVEIYATHDGTATSDATFADYNISSKLRLNGNIAGLDFDIVLSGTGAAQTMGLQITSTDTVTVNSTRIDVEI